MPRTKEQFEKIKEERSKSILKEALWLFSTKGYASTTIDDVAVAANCSHGLLYHYFPNKEALFISLMENYVIPKNKEIIAGVDFNQKAKFVMYDLLYAYLETLKSSDDEKACTLYLLLKLRLEAQYIPKPPITSKRKRIFDWMYDTIERGINEGDFIEQNITESTIAILSMFTGLAFYRINLGQKKFKCPKPEIIMNSLLKDRR